MLNNHSWSLLLYIFSVSSYLNCFGMTPRNSLLHSTDFTSYSSNNRVGQRLHGGGGCQLKQAVITSAYTTCQPSESGLQVVFYFTSPTASEEYASRVWFVNEELCSGSLSIYSVEQRSRVEIWFMIHDVAGVSNLRPTGRMQLRMAVNAAQHKIS